MTEDHSINPLETSHAVLCDPLVHCDQWVWQGREKRQKLHTHVRRPQKKKEKEIKDKLVL